MAGPLPMNGLKSIGEVPPESPLSAEEVYSVVENPPVANEAPKPSSTESPSENLDVLPAEIEVVDKTDVEEKDDKIQNPGDDITRLGDEEEGKLLAGVQEKIDSII